MLMHLFSFGEVSTPRYSAGTEIRTVFLAGSSHLLCLLSFWKLVLSRTKGLYGHLSSLCTLSTLMREVRDDRGAGALGLISFALFAVDLKLKWVGSIGYFSRENPSKGVFVEVSPMTPHALRSYAPGVPRALSYHERFDDRGMAALGSDGQSGSDSKRKVMDWILPRFLPFLPSPTLTCPVLLPHQEGNFPPESLSQTQLRTVPTLAISSRRSPLSSDRCSTWIANELMRREGGTRWLGRSVVKISTHRCFHVGDPNMSCT